ncbi:short-chain dehydrogenase/reductase [Gymnopus androsaceus JB14]|uniref:Short-chain dehydrogenase/reductase n=1 Tax=Gymnopus androsaceus JB14 TaxID=1447944 RepID=A0A6A4H198_9AGAR|nr:short-chain dehydrogenase/reductase [Gymnopus androsaceus JB14]
MSLSKLTPTFHQDSYPSISPTRPSLTQAGKTILITGGGVKIGFEIARSFALASASRVIIIGRRAEVLDEAVGKLRAEFQSTEFVAHQLDMASEAVVTSLWESLRSQNILVHVLVLNAAHFYPIASDTFSVAKKDLMEAYETNVGGNFHMSCEFVKQALRPAGLKLHLVHVTTAGIHIPAAKVNSYTTSKMAFVALLGRIADERTAEDVQIISFHPGTLNSDNRFAQDAFPWDKLALPGNFAVWAASPEATWLHGRFVWAHWDVDEMKADAEILRRLKNESDYLKIGVPGLSAVTVDG